MKRPEGFDKAPPSGPPARAKQSPAPAARRERPARRRSEPKPTATSEPKRASRTRREDPKRAAKREAAAAAAAARRAAADRRRYERAEMRRFTRRRRARRIAVGATLGTVGLVVLLVLVAIFSPILSLRTVTVDGTSRVDAGAVREIVEAQLGTPLALIDYGRIDAELRELPVIRSYRTETIPPGTIAVHVVERQPVAAIAAPAGDFLLVDAAGITVDRSAERLPGVPLVTESGTTLPNPAFSAAIEVLLAMPAELRAQVDTIQAKTRDDVWLTLAGVTQAVKWGSADDSLTKVRLFELLRANFEGQPGTFDVSAVSSAVFRPA